MQTTCAYCIAGIAIYKLSVAFTIFRGARRRAAQPNVVPSNFVSINGPGCDVYVGGKVRVSEFMISLDLQHCGSK